MSETLWVTTDCVTLVHTGPHWSTLVHTGPNLLTPLLHEAGDSLMEDMLVAQVLYICTASTAVHEPIWADVSNDSELLVGAVCNGAVDLIHPLERKARG